MKYVVKSDLVSANGGPAVGYVYFTDIDPNTDHAACEAFGIFDESVVELLNAIEDSDNQVGCGYVAIYDVDEDQIENSWEWSDTKWRKYLADTNLSEVIGVTVHEAIFVMDRKVVYTFER